MTEAETWLLEKESVREAISRLAITVLWEPNVGTAECDTALHHIKVWREGDCVKAEIKKVR